MNPVTTVTQLTRACGHAVRAQEHLKFKQANRLWTLSLHVVEVRWDLAFPHLNDFSRQPKISSNIAIRLQVYVSLDASAGLTCALVDECARQN
eukprot:SAG31_NODE_1204_length_9412_cov_3.727585_3_plen_93_part_00